MLTTRRTRRTAAFAAAVTAAALLSVGTAAATTGASGRAETTSTHVSAAAASTSVSAAARKKKIRFKGNKNFAIGGKIKIKGKVQTRRAKRVVVLTEKKGKRWVVRGKKRTNRKGAFTFKVNAGKKLKARRFKVTARPSRGLRRVSAVRKVKVQHRTGLTVGYSTTAPALASVATASGAVTGTRPGGRKVVAQLRFANGWQTVGTTVSEPDGGFAVDLPASWLYTAKARIRVTGGSGGMPAAGGRTTLQVVPTWAPLGAATSWSHLRAGDGRKFRWNPCGAPINYRVNSSRAPIGKPAADALVHQAIGQISEGTGLRFRHLGDSAGIYSPAPGFRGHDSDTKMLISWAMDHETAASFRPPGGGIVLAWGGGSGRPARDRTGSLYRFDRGGVVVDAAAPLTVDGTYEVLLHEIGHAVGLGHTEDPEQIMHHTANGGPNTWGAGDLTGLRDKGLLSGCVKNVRNRGALTAPVEVNLP